MSAPLPEAEVRRIYMNALDVAMRHAAAHLPRDEAREVAHHVASAVARRAIAEADQARSAPRLTPIGDVDAFIHRAVLNRLRELWRAQRRRTTAERAYEEDRSAIAPAWTQPGADLESRELHEVIDAAIAALPETRRQVFLLIRREQLSYKEVAARLGIGVGTVHTHLSRANAALRQTVADFRRSAVAGGSTVRRPVRTGT